MPRSCSVTIINKMAALGTGQSASYGWRVGSRTRANGTSGHYLRAAMEGIAHNMNYGLSRLKTLGIQPREIRLTGGGAKSAAWRQIMADVFGVPVMKMAIDESAALGAALQAAWISGEAAPGANGLSSLSSKIIAFDESSRCEPDSDRVRYYQEQQEKHDQLRNRLYQG